MAKARRRRVILWLLIAAIPLLMLGWAAGIEPGLLRVRRAAVETVHWPPARAPLRIVLISDLHAGSPHIGAAKLRRIVALANAEAPDIVLLGGDYIAHVLGGRPMAPEEIAALLAPLRARLGVFSVLGNHDHWEGQDGRVRQALERVGIAVLENEARHVPSDAGGLWIVGLGHDGHGKADIPKAFRGVPLGADRADPVVVLSHDPAVFYDIPRGVAAIVAGHTHGGQVRVPFLGALINMSRAPLRHSRGLILEQGRAMYVTAGVGTSMLPIRFDCPPEIVVLTIRAEPLKD